MIKKYLDTGTLSFHINAFTVYFSLIERESEGTKSLREFNAQVDDSS